MNNPASKPFAVSELNFLQDPEQAALYLAECYEESEALFQLALRDVAKARKGGIAGVARAAGLNRTNLYRALSKTGKPNTATLRKMIDALGFTMKVRFEPNQQAPPYRASNP